MKLTVDTSNQKSKALFTAYQDYLARRYNLVLVPALRQSGHSATYNVIRQN